ncbi:energy transducer TonB [Pseudoalteromonas luteoviolacea]|uniref:energy transducer TonB n=1 Tax=Pseudoalteromonas luteoviolacea TaxID=43657 RepID=UPI001B378584|nr:energy transducer TonB [Pseudoalteromonas luteoviolacea]MBQ4835762.1 energy transducer TonB [Pseudoalteromonas luteoviolacea]
MNKQRLTITALALAVLTGCQSSPAPTVTEVPVQNEQVLTTTSKAKAVTTAPKTQAVVTTTPDQQKLSCEPLRYQCHSMQPEQDISENTAKDISFALNIATHGYYSAAAIRLEKIKSQNVYEQAIVDYHLANMNMKRIGEDARALDYALKAIDSGSLPAEEYKSALILAIKLFVKLGWFELGEEKALNYLAYIGESFDFDIFEIFDQIAQQKKDQTRYELLLDIQTMIDEEAQNQTAQRVLDEIQTRIAKRHANQIQFEKQIKPPQKLQNNSTCQTLTYQCHNLRAKQVLPANIKQAIDKATKQQQDNNAMAAKETLESIKTNSDFETAMINRKLAYLYSDVKLHELSVHHASAAINSGALNAEDHKYQMRLEVFGLYLQGEFERAKQKIEAYLNYIEKSSDTYLDGVLLKIAEQQDDQLFFNYLQTKTLKNPQRAEILQSYIAFGYFGEIQEKTKSAVTPKSYKPVVIYTKEYDYPIEAAKQGITGSVTLEFDLNAKGEPVNIRVIEASPEGYFEQAGINALEQWRYKVNLNDTGNVIEGTGIQVQFGWNLGSDK